MQAEVMLKKTIDYLSGHLPGFAELIVKIVPVSYTHLTLPTTERV